MARVAIVRPLGLLLALALAGCAPRGRQPVEGSPSEGLVLVRRDASSADLYRVRLADGAVRRLFETPDRDETWPYWSEPARRLVFQSRPPAGPEHHRLRLLDLATGRSEPVAPLDAHKQHWAVWTLDGTRLAFVVDGQPGPGFFSGIGVVDLASGGFQLLAAAHGRVRFFRPEFAPDGRRLVAQRRSDRSDSALWILEPDAEPRPLTDGKVGFDQKPRFTRDGVWIVFTRRAARGQPGRLMRVRSDGGDATVMAHPPGADDHSARPSPVRDELAFISDRRGGPDAFLVDLAGGRPRPLTRTADRDEGAPRWSPDGEYLALTVLPAGSRVRRPYPEGARVVVLDRRGEVLLDVPGAMPDWMPPWP